MFYFLNVSMDPWTNSRRRSYFEDMVISMKTESQTEKKGEKEM